MQTSKIVLHDSPQNDARRKKKNLGMHLTKLIEGYLVASAKLSLKGSSKIVGMCHFITMGGDAFDEW
jgi:hypothetical protein